MRVGDIILTIHHFLVHGGWAPLWIVDFFLRNVQPHRRRMERGKHFKWMARAFGPLSYHAPRMVLATAMLPPMMLTDAVWPIDAFYGYLVATTSVDWITGSEDPPWRRWKESASAALKKLRIAPAPQPVIDV